MQHQEIKSIYLVQNEFQNTIRAFTSEVRAKEWVEANKHFVHLGELIKMPLDTGTPYDKSQRR